MPPQKVLAHQGLPWGEHYSSYLRRKNQPCLFIPRSPPGCIPSSPQRPHGRHRFREVRHPRRPPGRRATRSCGNGSRRPGRRWMGVRGALGPGREYLDQRRACCRHRCCVRVGRERAWKGDCRLLNRHRWLYGGGTAPTIRLPTSGLELSPGPGLGSVATGIQLLTPGPFAPETSLFFRCASEGGFPAHGWSGGIAVLDSE